MLGAGFHGQVRDEPELGGGRETVMEEKGGRDHVKKAFFWVMAPERPVFF